MLYSIRHHTSFRYSAPIRESMMELRMLPRPHATSSCLWFNVEITPPPRVGTYSDCWGNIVHFFDVPGLHEELEIATRAIVEVNNKQGSASPPTTTWEEFDAAVAEGDFWDYLLPSRFARSTELLHALKEEWSLTRRSDPHSLLEEICTRIYLNFAYAPETTRADSPIDEALDARRGVCQDFTHIFIALAREFGIPCRYISGYLHHEAGDRSQTNATHAWAETWLPQCGWIGFDPTNNSQAGVRHICTAIGRDYADVPPTRGIYKGRAQTELKVEVEVESIEALPSQVLSPLPSSEFANESHAASSTLQSGALSAVWPPPVALFVDDVSEQAQQQQQRLLARS